MAITAEQLQTQKESVIKKITELLNDPITLSDNRLFQSHLEELDEIKSAAAMVHLGFEIVEKQ